MKKVLIIPFLVGIFFLGVYVGQLKMKGIGEAKEILDYTKIFAEWLYYIFSIITPLMLGVIAYKANGLANRQNKLVELQNNPRFEFSTNLIYDEKTKKYVKETMRIRNVNPNGFIVEKDFKDSVYVEVKINGKTICDIQLIDYYIIKTGRIQSTHGKLLIPDLDNNAIIADLSRSINKYTKENKMVEITLKRYVYVEYENLYRDIRKEYYEVNSLGGHLMGNLEGEDKFIIGENCKSLSELIPFIHRIVEKIED